MKLQLDKGQMLGFQILEADTFRIGAKIAGKPTSPQARITAKIGNKNADCPKKISAKIGAKVGTKNG